MTCYEIWCNLKDTTKDLEFCRNVDAYLGRLKTDGLIEGHRIRRRKLGLGPSSMGEFNITIEVNDLAQLETAFQTIAQRTGQVELLHHAVYSMVRDLTFALYRDFPGAERGE